MLRPNPALAELTIEELANEIGVRCAGAIILAAVPESDNECESRSFMYGNRLWAVGILEVSRLRLISNMQQEAEEERKRRRELGDTGMEDDDGN